MSTSARYAAAYCRKYNLALVPIPPGRKFPTENDWGNKVITRETDAFNFYSKHPDWNMGVALGPSRICSFDVDDVEATQLIFDEFGWDLWALSEQFPTIQGKAPKFRVMFRLPEGVELPYHALNWPKRDGSPGRFTVFEIRSAADQQRQDVLPPSIHPDTGKPYEWLTPPNGHIPPPPDFLLQLWANWEKLKPQLQAVCPWAPKSAPPAPRKPSAPRDGGSVIEQYNAAHGIEQSLQAYGYKQQGKRWLSPHSTTGLPGVMVWGEQNKCFIHHASDPLCSDESGQPVGPFDLFCQYSHGGDVRKAVKAAADELGIKPEPRKPQAAKPAPEPAAEPPEWVDPDTGEILECRPPQEQAPVRRAVDYVSRLIDTTDKGKPLQTIENLHEICQRLGVVVRYNIIKKEEEILIPGKSFTVDNKANASLAWLSSECSKFSMPVRSLGEFLTYMADQNIYNPVAIWIDSKPWDGVDRFTKFLDTVRAKDEDSTPQVVKMKHTFITKWMVSAVAAAFNPNGVPAAGVLVFQGDQYIGKTKWFKSLVPEELRVLQDGVILRPDDKDSVRQCVSNWLVELGELDATFRKADIAALKSFLTKDRDVLRRAYAKKDSEYVRRTVFFASVNPREFLHDITGNRRYWTIECDWIDHSHGLDMQQVWAQVKQMYLDGEGYYLSGDEVESLNDHNKQFEIVDPIAEMILDKLDWEAPVLQWEWKSATEVLRLLGRDTCTQSEATRAAHIIRDRNGKQSRKSNGGRFLLVPPVLKL